MGSNWNEELRKVVASRNILRTGFQKYVVRREIDPENSWQETRQMILSIR